MIKSFKDRRTAALFSGDFVKGMPNDLREIARRKLLMLDQAGALADLKVPPQNKLEALSRARKGQYSIRVNDQWRLCFKWTATGPEAVEFVDYH